MKPLSLETSCEEARDAIHGHVEGELPSDQVSGLLTHLLNCPACKREYEARRKVISLLGQTFGSKRISNAYDATATFRLEEMKRTKSAGREKSGVQRPSASGERPALHEGSGCPSDWTLAGIADRFGAAPWWIVSTVLHALAILLIGLVTMAVHRPEEGRELVTVTQLERKPDIRNTETEREKRSAKDILESARDAQATDTASNAASNIVVPPEILAQAELSDHFETVNPDRPDTQSAYGNPEARMFHSVAGNEEPEGGGGIGGIGGTSLSDELIGVGGSGSLGAGGGWGGGIGTGVGLGSGSGRGSFGHRSGGGRQLLVMRHGGSPATESAVDAALDWLARHQEPDGHWSLAKYGGARNSVGYDAGATGIALLAFLGAGHSEKLGKYKDNVRRASQWLVEHQDAKGEWEPITGKQGYAHGIATLALAEAAAMGRNPKVKEAAQKGVEAVEGFQRKSGDSDREAWGYGADDVRNDTSVTGWQVMALKSAKVAGLRVNPAALEGALRWIEAGQDLRNLKPGEPVPYDYEGGEMVYRGTVNDGTQGAKNNAMTAVAALCRLFIGGCKPEHPGVLGPCNLMLKDLPTPDKNGSAGSYYYYYYSTFAMFQKGGEHWRTWNEALKKTLVQTQVKGGDDDGSWIPHSRHADGNCRVISTALGALCLEVYYRYLPVYRGH